MTISLHDLELVEQHWSVQSLSKELRRSAQDIADKRIVKLSVGQILQQEGDDSFDVSTIEQVATADEVAAIEGRSV